MTVHIDLTRDLHKVRARIDPTTLGTCLYAAPCAIGAMIDDPAERERLDSLTKGGAPVCRLLFDGELAAPEDQRADLSVLQSAFDNNEDSPDRFFETLEQLEAKYGIVPAA